MRYIIANAEVNMENTPWLIPIIKQINTLSRNNLKNNLKRYDITDAQLEVLLFLKKNSDKNINQRLIETELHLSNPTIVSIIDRLEEKKLVKRAISENDHRQKHIIITYVGKKLCNDLFHDFCNEENSLFLNISEKEKTVLKELLLKVLLNVSKGRVEK